LIQREGEVIYEIKRPGKKSQLKVIAPIDASDVVNTHNIPRGT
jgi:hypothetical protein